MAKKPETNVKWLVALAADLKYNGALVPVTGSRSYLFVGDKVYLLYGACPTMETARPAEQWNPAELAMLAEDRKQHGLERKAREYGAGTEAG